MSRNIAFRGTCARARERFEHLTSCSSGAGRSPETGRQVRQISVHCSSLSFFTFQPRSLRPPLHLRRFAQNCRKVACQQPVADEHLEPNEELRILRREAEDMRTALAVRIDGLGVRAMFQDVPHHSEFSATLGERCGVHHRTEGRTCCRGLETLLRGRYRSEYIQCFSFLTSRFLHQQNEKGCVCHSMIGWIHPTCASGYKEDHRVHRHSNIAHHPHSRRSTRAPLACFVLVALA